MTKLENIVMNRTSCNRMIANLVANDILQEVEKGIEVDVAREIFEEMQSCLIQRHWNGLDIVSFEFDAVKYAELKKKYTESEDTQ